MLSTERPYRERGQGHEANEVIPYFIDVLQQLLEFLTAHCGGLYAQLHALGHSVHLNDTWRVRGRGEGRKCRDDG